MGVLDAAYYDEARQQSVQAPLQQWLQDYTARLRVDPLSASERTAKMAAANRCMCCATGWPRRPSIAPSRATSAVFTHCRTLRDPYTERAGLEHFACKRLGGADNRAGCSMLSCSS